MKYANGIATIVGVSIFTFVTGAKADLIGSLSAAEGHAVFSETFGSDGTFHVMPASAAECAFAAYNYGAVQFMPAALQCSPPAGIDTEWFRELPMPMNLDGNLTVTFKGQQSVVNAFNFQVATADQFGNVALSAVVGSGTSHSFTVSTSVGALSGNALEAIGSLQNSIGNGLAVWNIVEL